VLYVEKASRPDVASGAWLADHNLNPVMLRLCPSFHAHGAYICLKQLGSASTWQLKGKLAHCYSSTRAPRDIVSDISLAEIIAELPYKLHVNHPEGLELWPEAGDGAILIIYDALAPERTDPDTFTVQADVIRP
jgi:hypothetical protein